MIITKLSKLGFTLVELLIACAILGILLTLAIPSYQHYWFQVYRADALRELAHLANLQQEYYSENYRYTQELKSVFGFKSNIEQGYVLANGYYAISIESDDLERNFNLYATVVSQQNADEVCYKIKLNSIGEKSAINKQGDNVSQTCWY